MVSDKPERKEQRMTDREQKAETLAMIEGYNSAMEMLEAESLDSVQHGICMTEDCDYTTQVEPDSTTGWCEVCNNGTVTSISELMFF